MDMRDSLEMEIGVLEEKLRFSKMALEAENSQKHVYLVVCGVKQKDITALAKRNDRRVSSEMMRVKEELVFYVDDIGFVVDSYLREG